MVTDFRQALRLLVSSPGFSALVIVVLAIGIGATTAIYSIVDGVLLRPLPFADAARLVSIGSVVRGEPDQTSNPDLQDWRASVRTLDRIAASASAPVSLTGQGEATVLSAAAVTGDFFELLGVAPRAGRALTSGDDRAGAPRVAVLSTTLWISRFGGDPSIVGRAITLDGRPVTIVGVMPAGFQFPIDEDQVQIWLPVQAVAFAAEFAAQRGASFLHAVGRLRSGASLEQAQAELSMVASRLEREYPTSNAKRGVLIRPLQEQLVHEYRRALIVLFGAVGAVLMIGCANVASLLLARGTARHREMAIRAALGASRGRLVRQLLTESVLLSAVGGACGLLVALWAVSALVAASPIEIPRLHDVRVDRGVLLFAVVVSMVTGVVFGLAPALHASRTDAGETLKDAARGTSARSARTRQTLVVAEVALALVLLASAGLLTRTLVALRQVDPGFVADHAIAMQLSLPGQRYPKAADQIAFYRRLVEEARAVPGVTDSAVGTTLPLSGSDIGVGFSIEGKPDTEDPATRKSAAFYAISPDYFRAMGIPVARGRAFSERDDERAPNVIVISETFAKRYWPNENPLGRRMTIGYNHTGPREIVGIVGDVKQGDLTATAPLEMYTPFPQTPWPFLAVAARTKGDPAGLAAGLRTAVSRIDRDQPAAEVKTLNEYLARVVATPRFTALLITSFAAFALLLAGCGLFSVLAYSVAQRRRELGIRLALGAQPADIRSLVVVQAVKLGAIGLAIGLPSALVVTRVLDSLLFGVGANDPATFAAVCALLAGVVLAAAYLPALRAARIDPTTALRAD